MIATGPLPVGGSLPAGALAFLARHTSGGATSLVPEITLALARDPTGIFEVAAAQADSGDGDAGSWQPPYWAFAWPGGQAAARHILDGGTDVRGLRVLDIGAGSGLAAIAAAKVGAGSVLAADTDPMAVAAITVNAAANGVAVETTTADVLGEPPAADIVLIGDLVYEPALATRVAALLAAALRRGAMVLVADRTNARRPPVPLELVAVYDAPLTPALPAHPFEKASLWRLSPPRPHKRRRP